MAQPDMLEIASADALWTWLGVHHASSNGIRLVKLKAAHRDKYVSREEVLDALLAHGWIDGRRFVVDDDRTAQLVTPRKQQAWSESYKARVERLRAEGRMHPAGNRRSGKASTLACGISLQMWTVLWCLTIWRRRSIWPHGMLCRNPTGAMCCAGTNWPRRFRHAKSALPQHLMRRLAGGDCRRCKCYPSNRRPCCSGVGAGRPRCAHALAASIRPRGVRARRPCCSR